jgi:hypothetical protein
MDVGVDYANEDGNATPDIATTRAAGINLQIVGIRGAWGYNGVASVDKTLARDADTVRSSGCHLFGYLMLDYATDPTLQANALIASYTRLTGDFPVALDLEMNTPPPGTTPASRVAMAEHACQLLQAKYGSNGVWIYTSLEQWSDHFGDLDSAVLGACPLWIKTPYPWNADNPPHPDDTGPLGAMPTPWLGAHSPGAWHQQFQGDSKPFPGFTSTVDISQFLLFDGNANPFRSSGDARTPWVYSIVGPGGIAAWQTAHGLAADNIIGPDTFALMCQ